METDDINTILHDKNLPLDDSSFYTEAFTLACLERRKHFLREADNFKRTCVEEYEELSRRLDITKIQESCAVRNVLRTRRLANLLINDSGELNLAVLPKLIELLKQSLYSIGPNRQYDAKRQEHLLQVVTLLHESKDLQRALKVIDKPVSHKYAEQIIRDTLHIAANVPLTDAHTRRAVLSAWMCLLRQNVGSCFATAPAIIIHDEQPIMFFKDISELLSTGRLKRTYGGIEYSVPLSSSWGAGDLKKPFILYLGEEFEQSRLWLSPGLEAAFLAVGLLDPDAEFEANLNKVKSLLLELLSSFPKKQSHAIITSEEIIRKVLLKQLGITEHDVEDFINRPRGMIQGGLMMQVIPAGSALKSKGKGELSATFLSQFLIACNAFKALADNALLKAWEFTVASFAETKSQFTRWNLYASLGLGPEEAGGIGANIYEIIKNKVEFFNQRVQEVQYEYEIVYSQLKTMETRLRSASSEQEAQWIKMEYQSKRNEFSTLEDMRNDVHYKAQRFANLFNELIEQYDLLFPKYFQEVYDADMHDVTAGPYDDSPAGFRLLYKYGRSNTSQWTHIRTPNEFIEDLATFFTATETEIVSTPSFEGMQSELSDIITSIVTHVRTKEFLETAFHRMAVAHQMPIIKDPLEHLDKIEKKPWAYTSGGTMGTLVSCYYRREQKPTEVSKWVESPIELLVFLVDSLKQMPPKLMEPYLTDPKKSMLIHSPTHAFLLKPGTKCFKKAWQTDAFTYTWVRDNIAAPQQKMIDTLWLDEEMMHFLIEHLAQFVSADFRHYFKKVFNNIYGNMRPPEFRDYLLNGMQKERGLRQAGGGILSADDIDSALYSLLPLFPRSSLRDTLKQLYKAIPSIDTNFRKRLTSLYDSIVVTYSMQSIISAKTLQDIAKALIALATEKTSFEVDYHAIISHTAQKMGLAMPAPIIFADSNWVKEEFGLVVNPGSGRFELWRIDPTGSLGAPMSNWEQWVNGSRPDIPWGIYTRPYEYA
ncbi:MAG: hypothetical protein H0X29_06405 [Parachlamydiaceae bacterium]|nr:hypothetical protein [Parachlamydiaceae bacterium]